MYRIVQKTLAVLLVTIGFGSTQAIAAGNQEPNGINLGGTSFFDGFGATEPGWTYLGYYQYATANHITDNSGNDSAVFKNPRINDLLILNQVAYTTPYTLFNGHGHVGFTVLVPFLFFNTHFDSSSTVKLTDNGNGFGDTTWGVYLQMDPVISGGRPVFSQRFEVDVIAPTGKYSSSKDINPGAHFWSFNPYWAMTWLPTPKLEVSARFNYLYNFANNDPAGVPPSINKAQAGQEDKFTYANGTTTDGESFGDTGKSSLFAIGPGVFWKINKHNMLAVNVYFQTMARNRGRGEVLNVHWTHPF
ncbi:MAG: transporter [Acidihalobacter sp.]